jgi:hypothetical protein
MIAPSSSEISTSGSAVGAWAGPDRSTRGLTIWALVSGRAMLTCSKETPNAFFGGIGEDDVLYSNPRLVYLGLSQRVVTIHTPETRRRLHNGIRISRTAAIVRPKWG